MVGVAEAFVLFFVGLLVGVLTALCDIVVFETGAFVAHFSLWVLYNALVAIHVDSRRKAIWWAIPFNLGYIELYYLCTAASFEGYAKSLVIPLAAMAVASPLLCYALWTAKRDRGPYGKILSILIAAGVVGADYLIFETYNDLYTIVVAVILLFVLLFWPARRLKFTPAVHPVSEPLEEPAERPSARSSARNDSRASSRRRARADIDIENEPEPMEAYDVYEDSSYDDVLTVPTIQRRQPQRLTRRVRNEPDTVRRQQPDMGRDYYSDAYGNEQTRGSRRSTRGTGRRAEDSARPRRSEPRRKDREREDQRTREAQRRAAAQRRARRERAEREAERDAGYYTPTVSTLGTPRVARPTSRGTRRTY